MTDIPKCDIVDYPQLTEKRLRKTRNVDFHRGKLAICEILLLTQIFKACVRGRGWGSPIYRVGNSTTKKHSYFPEYVCMCEGELYGGKANL